MADANKVTPIPLDLSIKDWQRTKIENAMPSTDHSIPKNVPSPAIVKPPDPNSNIFHSTNSICTRCQANKSPATIQLQQRIALVFANYFLLIRKYLRLQLRRDH